MELNAQIKKYRTELNLSQEELAEKVYVTRQTVSNWENDERVILRTTLDKPSKIKGLALI